MNNNFASRFKVARETAKQAQNEVENIRQECYQKLLQETKDAIFAKCNLFGVVKDVDVIVGYGIYAVPIYIKYTMYFVNGCIVKCTNGERYYTEHNKLRFIIDNNEYSPGYGLLNSSEPYNRFSDVKDVFNEMLPYVRCFNKHCSELSKDRLLLKCEWLLTSDVLSEDDFNQV